MCRVVKSTAPVIIADVMALIPWCLMVKATHRDAKKPVSVATDKEIHTLKDEGKLL